MVKAAAAPDGLESGTDFPIVCEVCLGPNPYLRMIKQPNAKECKVSGRIMTSFRWKPGAAARYKETVISPEVARAKGVCQCCLMDMEYNLPVGVRDALVASGGGPDQKQLPETGVNQTYYYDQVAKASREDVEAAYGKMANDKLLRMSRAQPYYDRNLPKLCSFWLKGACSRVVQGDCPFRPCCGTFRFPELAGSNPDGMRKLTEALERLGTVEVMRDKSADMEEIKEQMRASQRGSRDQNIRDRYHGTDDLTSKYIGKADKMDLTPPEVVPASNCAFVTYIERESAEAAAKKLAGVLSIKGARLKLMWGRPQKAREMQGQTKGLPMPPSDPAMTAGGPGMGMPMMNPFPYPGAAMPLPGSGPMAMPMAPMPGAFAMPTMNYPSMNPNQMGTRPDRIPPPPPGRPPQKK
ncbi:hypothetical protein T484DRAFT_1937320 [Baffinella frigidus]|nr:hypothetical protein T484DRAFT_1937320 [Cryptophyta sp. CCMP2293]